MRGRRKEGSGQGAESEGEAEDVWAAVCWGSQLAGSALHCRLPGVRGSPDATYSPDLESGRLKFEFELDSEGECLLDIAIEYAMYSIEISQASISANNPVSAHWHGKRSVVKKL